jgi:hypothetical protein
LGCVCAHRLPYLQLFLFIQNILYGQGRVNHSFSAQLKNGRLCSAMVDA